MWLEMSIIWSYLFGSMWFLLCSFLRAPTSDGFGPQKRKALVEQEEEDVDEETLYELFDRDILRINSRLLDLVLENFVVGFLGFYFYCYQLFE